MARGSIEIAEGIKAAERLSDEGKTPVFVAIDGHAVGVIAIADTLKENSKEAIDALKRLGLEIAIITGDNRRTARAIAKELGDGKVLAEVLPEEKAQRGKKAPGRGQRKWRWSATA